MQIFTTRHIVLGWNQLGRMQESQKKMFLFFPFPPTWNNTVLALHCKGSEDTYISTANNSDGGIPFQGHIISKFSRLSGVWWDLATQDHQRDQHLRLPLF